MTVPTARRSWTALARTFGPDLRPHRRTVLASFACRILAIGAMLVAPWPLKIIIDHVLSSRPLPPSLAPFLSRMSSEHVVLAMAAAIVTLTGVRAFAEYFQVTTAARVREQL